MALLLQLCLASQYSNAQVSTTGELITNSQQAWTGCNTLASGAFWGGTSGGPCPAVNEGGHIIFSYGLNTLSQTVALANALPNSGTGLQVNGYNYSWTVKNSNINGLQGGAGTYDTTASVNISLLSGIAVLESDTYTYNYYLPDHTLFTGTRTYTNPYNTTLADTIRLSVTGIDDGYWAGYYGPEFGNFSLSINYSVDPCADNPFYSPTCSGFADALAALSETATAGIEETTTSDSTATGMDTGTTTQTATVDPVKSVTEVTTDIGGAELTTSGEVIVSDGVPSTAKESAKESVAKEEQKAQESAVASTNTKEGAKVDAFAIAQNAVKQAEQTALSVAAQSIEQSLSAMANPADGVGLDSLGTGIRITGLAFLQDNIAFASESVPTQSYNLASIRQIQNQDQLKLSSDLPVTEVKTTARVDTTEMQSQTWQIQEQKQETVKSTVRNGGKVEGMEGGADMTALAKPPANFNQYLQAQLADAQFYQQREIYSGQKNLDNARAFRGLGSDRLHQQMVDSQWDIAR